MRFETTTELLPHQAAAVAKLLPSRVGALFMDLGTGKSRTALELARVRAAKWDRLIWCCPVSAKETIHQEALKHTMLRANDVYVFDDHTHAQSLPRDRTLYIVGIESLSSSVRVTAALDALITERSFVIVDESTYIKGHRAARTQRLTALAARARYRLILTGTPLTQGAVDLFAQLRFLSPQILGYGSFWSFAANHLEYEVSRETGRRTGRIVRAHNEEVLAARMQPYVYQVKKDECLTLPDKLYERRWCELTFAQRSLYEQAKTEWLTLDVEDWDGKAIYRLFTALQTIVCGWWRRTDPQTSRVETLTAPHFRLVTLNDTLTSIPPGEKVVIWAKYRRAVSEIVAQLTATSGAASIAQFHGGLSERARNDELARWRLPGETRFLVATQSAGSHALTLTEAAYVVFYADSFKYAERIQAEDRCHRIGQTRRPVYITLATSSTIDTRIANALARKENVLRVFQDRIERCRARGLKARAERLVRAL